MIQDVVGAVLDWIIVMPLVLWASRGALQDRWRMILILVLVYVAAVALTHVPHYLHALRAKNWNWGGKTIEVVFIYAAIFSIPALKPARSYITLRQRPGSIVLATAALALLVLIQVAAQLYYRSSESFSAETLAFQATLPGMSEEPLWRAAVLGCLNTVCLERVGFGRTQLGWAVLISALLFALAHALAFDDGFHLIFDAMTFAFVAAVGLLLGYVAELTGSILLPILFHNIFNVVGQVLQMPLAVGAES